MNKHKKKWRIPKVAIVGGPGGGKSTILALLKKELLHHGHSSVIVPETATIIFGSGITDSLPNLEAQRIIAEYQLQQEKYFMKHAEHLRSKGEKPVVILDRCMIDNKAYCSEIEWETILDEFKLSEKKLEDYYDIIIFIDTAPKKYYSTKNNNQRSEKTHKKAWIRNASLRKVYADFKKTIYITNYGGLKRKNKNAIHSLLSGLGLLK